MTFSSKDINNLYGFSDIILPETGKMPSALQIIAKEDIVWMLEETNKYQQALIEVLNFIKKEPSSRVTGGISELSENQKIEMISLMESIIPEETNLFIEMIYLLYYSKEEIHNLIGWDPDENSEENKLEPFNNSILENVKKREPFWRKV